MSTSLNRPLPNLRPRRLRSLLASVDSPILSQEEATCGTRSLDFPETSVDDPELLFRQQLEKHPQFRGRSRLVSADFHAGVLRLEGCLPSFYLKQLVQALAHKTVGVARVVNRIDVRDSIGRDGELETWRLDAGQKLDSAGEAIA